MSSVTIVFHRGNSQKKCPLRKVSMHGHLPPRKVSKGKVLRKNFLETGTDKKQKREQTVSQHIWHFNDK